MKEITGELLSSALRRLAEDVAQARRRSAQLQYENQELRATLESLRRSAPEAGPRAVGPGQGDAGNAA